MLRLRYYRETGQAAEAQKYETYLRETKQWRDDTPVADPGADARAAATKARVGGETWSQPEQPGFLLKALAALSSLGTAIPGLEAVQAKAASLATQLTDTPRSYTEALEILRSAQKTVPKPLRIAANIAGAAPLMAMLPGGPMASGALLGGAGEALSADPMSLTERGVRTAVGTAGGALVGRAGDKLVTSGKVLLSKNPASQVIAAKAARALSAKTMYDAALSSGQGKQATSAVQAYVAEPEIADIVSELQKTSQFANTPAHAPEMLDAIYKTLSDRAGTIKKGLEAVNPSRPNIGRFRGKDIESAQQRLLTALKTPDANVPAVMPTYENAVADYAKRSKDIAAMQKGYEAVTSKLSGTIPLFKNLDRKTPEAFAEWAKTASPSELDAAKRGILGATKEAFGQRGKTLAPGRRATAAASGLLRIADPNAGTLAQFGLLGLNSMR